MEILLLRERIRFGCWCWCCSHLAIENISTPDLKDPSFSFLLEAPSVCAYLSIYRRRLCICIIWKLTVNWRVANWKGSQQKDQQYSFKWWPSPCTLPTSSATFPLCIRQRALPESEGVLREREEQPGGRSPGWSVCCTQSSTRMLLLPIWVAVFSYLPITLGPSATVGHQFIIHWVYIETLHLSFSTYFSLLPCLALFLKFIMRRTTFTTAFIVQQTN